MHSKFSADRKIHGETRIMAKPPPPPNKEANQSVTLSGLSKALLLLEMTRVQVQTAKQTYKGRHYGRFFFFFRNCAGTALDLMDPWAEGGAVR